MIKQQSCTSDLKLPSLDIVEMLGGHHSRRELWATFLNTQRTRVMAEIGVWKGDFAADVLKDA